MRDLQLKMLVRTIERLSDVLQRAERRCMRYEKGDASLERALDISMVEHIAVAAHQLKRFEREHVCENSRDAVMEYLKDAISQLHELSDFLRDNINELDVFLRRSFEREERWVRMLNISLVALFVNICADNIRYALQEIDQQMNSLKSLNTSQNPKKTKHPHLRVVK